jgi:hypothetical protein
MKTDTQPNGTEQRIRNKHTLTANWVSTKAHIGEKTASSINNAWKTRYGCAKNWNMTPVSHHVHKSTQNRSKS